MRTDPVRDGEPALPAAFYPGAAMLATDCCRRDFLYYCLHGAETRARIGRSRRQQLAGCARNHGETKR